MTNGRKNKEGFTEKAIELAEYLLESLGKNKGTVTYKEASERLYGHAQGGRGLRFLAGHISSFCMKNGLPPISAILCNSETNLPGQGFDIMFNENIPWKNYKDKLTEEKRKKTIEELQQEVYNCADWSVLEDAIAS